MATETKTEKQEPQLTDQEINDLASKASEVLFGPPTKIAEQIEKEKAASDTAAKKAADDKAAEDAKAKGEADKKAAEDKAKAEAEKKPAEAKTETPQAQPKPGPTVDEIADRVAQKMAPKQDKAQGTELSPEDKTNREVLEFMAKENAEYGRLLKRFDAFIPAEKSYRESWEKENPGKKYDPADEEHAEFYSANDPIQTEEDQEAFDRAENRLEAAKTAERIISERDEKRTREEAVKTVSEKLKNHQLEVTGELLKAVDPELGKLDLTKTKLKDKDVFADAAIRPYVPALAAMTAELVKAFTPGLNYQFSDSNPLHVEIMRSIYGYENELLKLPPDQQLADDGRKLAPIEDYNKMSPAEKRQHWTIWMEPNAVRALLLRDFAAKAKEDLALFRSKMANTGTASAASGAQNGAGDKSKEEAKDKGKKEFPNTTGGAEGGAAGGAGDSIGPADAKIITSRLFET